MSKRGHVEGCEAETLVWDLLELIGLHLYRDRGAWSSVKTLARYAQCNLKLNTRFKAKVTKCAALDWWCLLCLQYRWKYRLGCHFNRQRCLVANAIDERGGEWRRLSDREMEKKGLCRQCCQQRCGLCLKGTCGCHDDVTCCDLCERTICQDCRWDDDQCYLDDESGRLLCTRCREQYCSDDSDEDEEPSEE